VRPIVAYIHLANRLLPFFRMVFFLLGAALLDATWQQVVPRFFW